MEAVQPDDIIIHLVKIKGSYHWYGISRAKSNLIITDNAPPDASAWINMPPYQRIDLKEFNTLDTPVPIEDFFNKYSVQLQNIEESSFYVKYGINKELRMAQKYFANCPYELYELFNEYSHEIDFNPLIQEEPEEGYILRDSKFEGLPEKDKETIIQARIGQGKYRVQLINYWGKCSVTGCKAINLLNASHLKPWKDCELREHLDVYNGLLLIPNLDKLLDRGLISFQDSGQILISSKLTKQDLEILGINESMKLGKVAEQHKAYLAYHREKVFKK